MKRRSTEPRRYQVVVNGRLGPRFADGFDGLNLATRPGESTLTGWFGDQAQLYGLLDQLRDLGIELVSVNAVD